MSIEPHKMRVIDEARDLDAKIANLCKFLRSPKAEALHDMERHAMMLQLTAMESYLSALRVRLRLWLLDDDVWLRAKPPEPLKQDDPRVFYMDEDTYRMAITLPNQSANYQFMVRRPGSYASKAGMVALRAVDAPGT